MGGGSKELEDEVYSLAPKKRKKFQSIVEYIAFRLFIGLFRALPYALSRGIALCLFHLVGYKLGIRRKVAEIQIRKVFPNLTPVEVDAIVRQMYKNLALSTLETYVVKDDVLVDTTTISGKENVDEALAMDKGALLVTAHFGNWEAARIMPAKGIPVAVIAKKQRNYLFNDYTDKIRTKQGAFLIDMKTAMRGIVEYLGKNSLVAILADQNAGGRGMITDFFGYPASHWKGAAKISLKKKIPVVPGFALRTLQDNICVVFEPVIYHPDWDDNDENCLKLIKEINLIMERYIRAHPEQWFWVHKRWKGAYDMFKDSN